MLRIVYRKQKRKIFIWSSILFLVGLQLFLLFGARIKLVGNDRVDNVFSSVAKFLSSSTSSDSNLDQEDSGPKHQSYSMSQDFYDEAYKNLPSLEKLEFQPLAGIVPHHLLVKNWLAAYFDNLKSFSYDTVVIISPNHFQAGQAEFISSDTSWQTPYGEVKADRELNKSLLSELSFVKNDFKALDGEHGVSGLLPFIKKTWPKAKVMPVIIDVNSKPENIKALADFLSAQNADNSWFWSKKKTLVLASIDFSHYQTLSVANFHDDVSQAVINNLAFSKAKSLEIDSPPALEAVLRYAASTDEVSPVLAAHTNSSQLLDNPDLLGTSHLFYYFYPQSKNIATQKTERLVSFLFFGDLMLDRHVKEKMDQKGGLGYLFDKLAGEEKRFFMGTDFVAANLEGAVTNNGQHYAPVNSFDFAFAPELIKGLKKYYFNFFSTANNHLSDQGPTGIKETYKNLTDLEFYFSGCADATIGDCSSKIIPWPGTADKKISFIGLSMVYHDPNLEEVISLIKKNKAASDLVVVNIHWGTEYQHQPNAKQQDWAHAMIDAGADLIIGNHPHVVQGMEIYKDKLIFYSLGNFVFDQYFSVDTQEELALGINLVDNHWQASLFPLKSNVSQPVLMDSAAKKVFLKKFLGWSKLSEDVKTAILDSGGIAVGN